MNKFITVCIRVYRRFFSIFSYGSCRFIPSCSEYGLTQFQKNGFFKAFYFTITRILKCNQFFSGGFDYPVVSFLPKKVNYKKIEIEYWYIPYPNKKNYYYIIKNRKWTKYGNT